MPRYYFNIHDGKDLPDHEGLEFPSKEAAWSEAVRSCGEMLRDVAGNLPTGSEWRMNVTDGHGETVLILRFVGTESSRNVAANSN